MNKLWVGKLVVRHTSVCMCVASLAFLSGCATMEERIAENQNLNCSQLDQKIGEHKYIKRRAEVEGIVSDVVGVVGNKKQKEDASFDGAMASISESDSSEELKALEHVKRAKDCPPSY